jgi:hypothetical protein
MAKVRRRGGIKKRGTNSWPVSFFKHIDTSGKRVDFSETVRGSRIDAERFLQKKLQEFDLGILGDAASMTLNEFFENWLETHSKLRNTARTGLRSQVDLRSILSRNDWLSETRQAAAFGYSESLCWHGGTRLVAADNKARPCGFTGFPESSD